jgi:hypothetical protein
MHGTKVVFKVADKVSLVTVIRRLPVVISVWAGVRPQSLLPIEGSFLDRKRKDSQRKPACLAVYFYYISNLLQQKNSFSELSHVSSPSE